MIASWIMKRMVRSIFVKVSRGDAEAAFAGFADDGVYDIPLELSAGGTLKGKKAIIEGYRKWYEQFPKRKLVAKNIAFAAYPLSPTNVIMSEWTCEETDKEGNEFKYDGVTVTESRKGKGIRSTEYIACKGLPQLSTPIKPLGKA